MKHHENTNEANAQTQALDCHATANLTLSDSPFYPLPIFQPLN
jgi:hypothetical protein